MTFGKEFTQAVEQKQIAQQEAERAKFVVERVRPFPSPPSPSLSGSHSSPLSLLHFLSPFLYSSSHNSSRSPPPPVRARATSLGRPRRGRSRSCRHHLQGSQQGWRGIGPVQEDRGEQGYCSDAGGGELFRSFSLSSSREEGAMLDGWRMSADEILMYHRAATLPTFLVVETFCFRFLRSSRRRRVEKRCTISSSSRRGEPETVSKPLMPHFSSPPRMDGVARLGISRSQD
jgi:hypothetical protein